MNERFEIYLKFGGKRKDLIGFMNWISENVTQFKKHKGLQVWQTIEPFQNEFTEFLRLKGD
ncbi:hypothetical protein [Gracilibacillus dipsosauri]|uniref:hypothetical protein n=1 Tax=Gracilibacillus dipsosauri TaxID=178340 RepID=UPI002409C413